MVQNGGGAGGLSSTFTAECRGLQSLAAHRAELALVETPRAKAVGHGDLQGAELPLSLGPTCQRPSRARRPRPLHLNSSHCHPHPLPDPCGPPKSSPTPLCFLGVLPELPSLLSPCRTKASCDLRQPFLQGTPRLVLPMPDSAVRSRKLGHQQLPPGLFPCPHDTSGASWTKHTWTEAHQQGG